MFSGMNIMDQISYKSSTKILTVTRNPFGFINKRKMSKYIGVANAKIDDRGNVSDTDFEKIVASILKNNDIEIATHAITVDLYKALPDTMDEFSTYFLGTDGSIKNSDLFKRRIIGLTSYFRSAQEQLMPKFDKHMDLHKIKVPMSDHQFSIYEKERMAERELEKRNLLKSLKNKPANGLYEDSVSTYRIFSRVACNFVFPETMTRPKPAVGKSLQEMAKLLNEEIEDEDGDKIELERKRA